MRCGLWMYKMPSMLPSELKKLFPTKALQHVTNAKWKMPAIDERTKGLKWSPLFCFVFYLFWPFLPANGAALNLPVLSLSKAKKRKIVEAPLGSKIGKQIQGKEERQRVPYVGEKHVLINTVFLLFQLRSHTLNEDRQQGKRLDRGGERGEVGGNSLKNWA